MESAPPLTATSTRSPEETRASRNARRTIGSSRLKRRRACEVGGGGAGTRTPDTEIMILLLYQLSYAAEPRIEMGGGK